MAAVLTLVLATATASSVAGASQIPRAQAVRVEHAPVIDGRVLGDTIWETVPPQDSFTQVEPA